MSGLSAYIRKRKQEFTILNGISPRYILVGREQMPELVRIMSRKDPTRLMGMIVILKETKGVEFGI